MLRKRHPLSNEHRVAEAEEAVALLHGDPVGVQHLLASGEGGNQHDQRGLRQVEVGDQGVHGLEAVAGVDEDVGPAGLFGKVTVPVGKAFDGPAGGGPHTDDPAPLGPGLVQQGGGLGGEHAELRMHVVVGDLLDLYGAEGPQTHVEGHPGRLDALGLDGRQQLRVKWRPAVGAAAEPLTLE